MDKLKIKTLKDGTKINEKQFFKWIEALESGEYSQTRDIMQDSEGYCCLGVACKVIIPDKDIKYRTLSSVRYIDGAGPYQQPSSPNWLSGISFDVNERLGVSLIGANDGAYIDRRSGYGLNYSERIENHGFNDIATVLRDLYQHDVYGLSNEN